MVLFLQVNMIHCPYLGFSKVRSDGLAFLFKGLH